MEGQVPYQDFFHFFTPGSLTLLAGLYLVFGATVGTVLLSVVLLGGGIAAATMMLARASGIPLGWAAFAGWLAVNVSVIWWPTPSHHWFATLMALVALATAIHAARTSSASWSVAAGVMLAGICWFLQPRGVLICLATGLALVALRPWMWKTLSLGGLLALLPVLILWLVVRVDLPRLWEDVVVFPLFYYPQANAAPFLGLDLLPSAPLVDPWRKVLQIFFQVSFVWLALLATGVSLVFGVRRRDPRIVLLAAAGLAAAASVLYRPLIGHVTFVAPLLVPSFVWVFWQASCRWRYAKVVAHVLAPLYVLVFVPSHEAWLMASGQMTAIPTPRGAMPIGSDADAAGAAGTFAPVASYVLSHTAPGEPIFAYPALPAVYFALARPNATGYDYLWPGENTPAQFADVARTLDQERPRLVLVDHSASDAVQANESAPARESDLLLARTLERLYVPAFRSGAFEILELRATPGPP